MRKTLLLVDDESAVTSALKRALCDEEYHIVTARTGEEALAIFDTYRPQVVISDEMMPGMGGAQFLSAVRLKYPGTVRIMLTGHASIEETLLAVNEGEVYRFFTKPWDDLDLKMAVRAAFEKYLLEDENRRLLQTVKRQSQELRVLEDRYPGITSIQRDEQGCIILSDDDTSEEESEPQLYKLT